MNSVQSATRAHQSSKVVMAFIGRKYLLSQLGRSWVFNFPMNLAYSCSHVTCLKVRITEFVTPEGADQEYSFSHCGIARECEHGYYCRQRLFGGYWAPPTVCGKGTLCDQMGLAEPLSCPPGFFCINPLSKQECVLGFHCPEGTHTPKRCASLGCKGLQCSVCFVLWAIGVAIAIVS